MGGDTKSSYPFQIVVLARYEFLDDPRPRVIGNLSARKLRAKVTISQYSKFQNESGTSSVGI